MQPHESISHPDELTDDQFEVIAEMAENDGDAHFGGEEAKRELESMGLLKRREGGGWQFTPKGEQLAEVYRTESKARKLRRRKSGGF